MIDARCTGRLGWQRIFFIVGGMSENPFPVSVTLPRAPYIACEGVLESRPGGKYDGNRKCGRVERGEGD